MIGLSTKSIWGEVDPVVAFTGEIQHAVDAINGGTEPTALSGVGARDALTTCAIKKRSRSGQAKLCRSLEQKLADHLTCIPVEDVNPARVRRSSTNALPIRTSNAHPHSGFQDNIITHSRLCQESGPQSFSAPRGSRLLDLHGDIFWRTFGTDEPDLPGCTPRTRFRSPSGRG